MEHQVTLNRSVWTLIGVIGGCAILSVNGVRGQVFSSAELKPLVTGATPVRSCQSLASVNLSHTVIKSAALAEATKIVPAPCLVTATVSHPDVGDEINVFIGLPSANWNGRFEGTGGEGWSGGDAGSLRQPLSFGWATGATDAGHQTRGASFVLDPAGRLNWHAVRDYAHVGIHEMTRVGKALTEAFYGRPPVRSYLETCSSGGRQAVMEAQRYPNDYDGILAGAPNIYLPQVRIAYLWPNVLMRAKGYVPLSCKLRAATAAAIRSCDEQDGLNDGIVNDPRACRFEARGLVGTSVPDCGTFTKDDAEIVQGIWDGPRRRDGSFMWYGFEPGTFIEEFVDDTQRMPTAHGNTLEWWRYFLYQDPKWEPTTLTRAQYEEAWDQSIEQYGAVIGTADPDLTAFRDGGGKLMLWHGWLDHSIPVQGTLHYFTSVQRHMGGSDQTDRFVRLFLAPGAGHCGGGDGFQPADRLAALATWVEQGVAPEALPGIRWDLSNGQIAARRPVCRFPLVARFSGKGSVNDAANFSCEAVR